MKLPSGAEWQLDVLERKNMYVSSTLTTVLRVVTRDMRATNEFKFKFNVSIVEQELVVSSEIKEIRFMNFYFLFEYTYLPSPLLTISQYNQYCKYSFEIPQIPFFILWRHFVPYATNGYSQHRSTSSNRWLMRKIVTWEWLALEVIIRPLKRSRKFPRSYFSFTKNILINETWVQWWRSMWLFHSKKNRWKRNELEMDFYQQ